MHVVVCERLQNPGFLAYSFRHDVLNPPKGNLASGIAAPAIPEYFDGFSVQAYADWRL